MHPFGSPPDSTRQSGPGTLGALVDAMPLPALVICGGQVEYVNRAARTLLGPEPVGRPLDDLVHPADREGLSDALDRCAIRTACGEVDVRLQTHQGSVDARVEIMPLPGGGARRLGLLLHDLGGVRVAERALQESEERYRLLVEHSPDAIYLHERGRISYANPAAARFLGLSSPDDLIGRHVLDHIHPEDRDLVAERIATAARERRAITHVMTRFMTYDGRGPLWVEVAASPAYAGRREQFQVICHDLSERLAVERALQESEERYRRLVESSPDAIYVQVNGLIVYANRAAAAMLGVARPEDLVGRHVLDHVHPEYRDVVAERIRRAMENDDIDPYVVERLRSYDGRDLYVHIRAARVRYGQDEAVQVVLRDVSEQVRTLEDLRRTDQRLREVLDHARDMSYRMSIDPLRFDYVSPAAEHLSGLASEQVRGADPRGILAGIHPDDQEGFVTAFRTLVSGGHDGDREPPVQYRWLHTDGTYHWYSDNRSLVRGADGAPVAVVGSVRDITDQKQAAEALRESEARARALFENIGDAFLLFDDALRIVDCNERAVKMFGRPREILLAQGAADVGARLAIAGETLAGVLEATLAGGRPRHRAGVELLSAAVPEGEPGAHPASGAPPASGAHPASGAYVDLAAYGVPVNGGQRVALLCRDVTASRRLEAALRQSEQMEAVGRLAAGVAHDFGNLLSVVEGECELLEAMLPPDSPAAREIQAIQLVAESGTSVIRQLAAVGRDEQIEPEVLHLNVLIRRNEPVLRRLLREGVALELGLSAAPLYAWGDPGQVTRVLTNLVINAVDAIAERADRAGRAGLIRIATRPAHLDEGEARALGLAPGRYAVLSVSDNGQGIAEEDLKRLFQPHYTRHRAAGRHGLGLSVVYGIVAQNGGTVLVDSRLGVGTTFTLYVPALDPAPSAEADGQVPPG